MAHAREAACEAIKQLTVGWHARALLLGEDVPCGVASSSEPCAGESLADLDTIESKEERRLVGRRVVEGLTHVITACNAGHDVTLQMVRSALTGLGNLSGGGAIGLDLCLICGVLHEVDELLRFFALRPELWCPSASSSGSSLPHPDVIQTAEAVSLAVTVVWNLCLDPVGKRKEESLTTLPNSLGRILHALLQQAPRRHLTIKVAIAGALGALYIFEEAKPTGLIPLFDEALNGAENVDDIAAQACQLLREGNQLNKALSSGRWASLGIGLGGTAGSGLIPGSDSNKLQEVVAALIANSVQLLRLLAELPQARGRIGSLILEDSAESADLCSQIFSSTPLEREMFAYCKVVVRP
eukprot:NODE_1499_length_1510_cov_40.802190_g1352_i0.p1 GENE.NODE_1499_length_1510_cov_40.802190_g1352_i0~~NODE_1499_length_1510_cov_40.802190_g1352_i0.p1  ORF type:complete len:355 (+),score=68.05 NODE_1499_length_1510_cov_40.802190_g1352_i0:350-1414(+)